MPLYEYECSDCALRFERIQKFSDPIVKTCPTCGGPVQKLPSSPAIKFKGTGWYVTDYAKKTDAGQSDEDTHEPSGSKESDSKPTDNSASTDKTKSTESKQGTTASTSTPSASSDSSK